MNKSILAAIAALLLLVALPVAAGAQVAQPSSAQRALQWLQCTQQQPNGQIGSGGNPVARSAEVALGLAAAGQPASAFRLGTISLADYLKTATSTDVGTNGELLLARASQGDAGPTATVVAQLTLAHSASGEYGSDVYSDGLAILGLRAAGQAVADDAIKFLKDHQASNGAWAFDGTDQFTDSNTTALVIQALLSTGLTSTDPSVSKAFTYLASVFGQGGFAIAPGSAPDPNSDELAIQAIVAGQLQSDSAWRSKLDQATQHLLGQQIVSGPDAGAINGLSKLFATTFAPNALLLRPLTSVGVSETRLDLLACSAPAADATPTPQPKAVRLPQTGSALPAPSPPLAARSLLAGLLLVLIGGIVLRRPRRER